MTIHNGSLGAWKLSVWGLGARDLERCFWTYHEAEICCIHSPFWIQRAKFSYGGWIFVVSTTPFGYNEPNWRIWAHEGPCWQFVFGACDPNHAPAAKPAPNFICHSRGGAMKNPTTIDDGRLWWWVTRAPKRTHLSWNRKERMIM